MQLSNNYKKNLKIVYKHFNRGPADMKSAVAVECAGEQNKFWDMYNNIFEYSRQMQMNAIAKKIGLNMIQFQRCTKSGKYENKIQADTEKGSELGIRGTPSFIINKKLVVGALPYETMEKYIKDAI